MESRGKRRKYRAYASKYFFSYCASFRTTGQSLPCIPLVENAVESESHQANGEDCKSKQCKDDAGKKHEDQP